MRRLRIEGRTVAGMAGNTIARRKRVRRVETLLLAEVTLRAGVDRSRGRLRYRNRQHQGHKQDMQKDSANEPM